MTRLERWHKITLTVLGLLSAFGGFLYASGWRYQRPDDWLTRLEGQQVEIRSVRQHTDSMVAGLQQQDSLLRGELRDLGRQVEMGLVLQCLDRWPTHNLARRWCEQTLERRGIRP